MLYYLHDSAACPQGDLPWSSIEISASPEYVDASFWNFISHAYNDNYTRACCALLIKHHVRGAEGSMVNVPSGNMYVAFAIATPVAWSVNERCDARPTPTSSPDARTARPTRRAAPCPPCVPPCPSTPSPPYATPVYCEYCVLRQQTLMLNFTTAC